MSKLKVNTITNTTGGAPSIPGFTSGGGGDSSGVGVSAWGDFVLSTLEYTGLNIFSITKDGVGAYRVTFTTPMPSINYSVQATADTGSCVTACVSNTNVSDFILSFYDANGAHTDAAVFGMFTVVATNALPPKGGTGADAWARCNATGAFNASYNFSGIVRNSEGNYTLTFTSPMPNANYAVVTGSDDQHSQIICINRSTTNLQIQVANPTAGGVLDGNFSLVVHATNATLPSSFSEEQIQSVVDLAQSGTTNPGCSAWGNITSTGVVSNGLNVASVTKGTAGTYTVTFTTPMPNDTYSVVASSGSEIGVGSNCSIFDITANSFEIIIARVDSGAALDQSFQFAVFATNALPPKGGTGTDAWVLSGGDGAILNSFNISSVSKIGTGAYRCNFISPMPTTNYAVIANPSVAGNDYTAFGTVRTTQYFEVQTALGGFATDAAFAATVNATNATLPSSFSEEQIQSVVDLAQSGDTNPGASAWGRVAGDGTLRSGLNCTVEKINLAYRIRFNTPMPDANYAVTFGSDNTNAQGKVVVQSSGAMDVQMVDVANSTALDRPFYFTVFATNALPPKGGTGTDSWVLSDSDATILSSYNIASVVATNGIGAYRCTFITPMPTTFYAVNVTPAVVGGDWTATCTGRATTHFDVQTVLAANGVQSGFSATVNATNATLPLTVTQEQIESAINNPGCSAWGDVTSTTGVLSNGLNVSSVTRTGTGRYTVTFTTPMPNDTYSVVASGGLANGAGGNCSITNKTANSFGIIIARVDSGIGLDQSFQFAVFATNALPPKGGTGTDAWVLSESDATILSSYNIASVVATNGIGAYRCTFITPMPTAFYAVNVTPDIIGGDWTATCIGRATTHFDVQTVLAANGVQSGFSATVNATNATLPLTVTQEQIESAINNPGCSAWGNITSTGVVSNGLNVSSVTRLGQGVYQVNLATPMPDVNYSAVVTGSFAPTVIGNTANVSAKTASSFKVDIVANTGAPIDQDFNFTVFATNALPPKGGTGADAWATSSGEGFNIASVTQSSGVNGNNFVVVFTTPMPSDDYSVVATPITTSDGTCFIRDRTSTGFTVVTRDYDGTPKALGWGAVVHATNATLPLSFTSEQIDAAINNPGCSAWGAISSNGNLVEGLNCTSSKIGVGEFQVTFQTPMPNANYAINTTTHSILDIGTDCYVANIDANGFRIFTSNNISGGNQDPTGAGGVYFTVFATNALPPKGGTGTDAWATFNCDPIALNASFNISSVTRTTAGLYNIVFTTPMPTANYAVTIGNNGNGVYTQAVETNSKTTAGFTIRNVNADTIALEDAVELAFTVNATNATLPTTFTEAQIQSVIDTQPQGIAKAWVLFSGATPGTITNSFNVSSITDNGTGDFSVNFTTALANNEYAVSMSTEAAALSFSLQGKNDSLANRSTTVYRFQGIYHNPGTGAASNSDGGYHNLVFFSN